MKKHKILYFAVILIAAFSLALVFCPRAWAGKQVVGPYEVIVYEAKDFVGKSRSWKLPPDKPYLYVLHVGNDLNERISSLHVGSKVGVWLFQHPLFGGTSYSCEWKGKAHDYTTSDRAFMSSAAELNCNDFYSSLIIFRKDVGGLLGVALVDKDTDFMDVKREHEYRFIPIPAALDLRRDCHDVKVKYLESGSRWWTTKLEEVDEIEIIFPSDASALMGFGGRGDLDKELKKHKVTVTLYDGPKCSGNPVTFPGLGSKKTSFVLSQYGFGGKTRSVHISYEGTLTSVKRLPPAPPKVRVRAPAAPTPKWEEPGTDRPGSNYKYFLAPRGLWQCQEACKKDPRCKAYTFVKPTSKHKYAGYCWLKSRAPRPVAKDCCISGVKTTVVGKITSPTALPKPGVAPMPTIPDVAGKWTSNVGVVYEFTQSGNRFNWTVAKLHEKGQGTISGKELSASWSGQFGAGSAKGRITQVDAKGRATRIEWNNGAIFSRQKPGVVTMKPGLVPLKPGVVAKGILEGTIPRINVTGRWQSNMGVEYKFTQSGDRFWWTCLDYNEKGEGTIMKGSEISALWSGDRGSGSAKGRIISFGPSHIADKIEWNNGVTFIKIGGF